MTMDMSGWKFLTNHALVLSWIARHSQSTAREIALAIGITERTALKIVGELDETHYINRRRKGRRNVYRVNYDTPLRHPIEGDVQVGELLRVIAPRKRRRAPEALSTGSDVSSLKKVRRTA